MKNRVTLLGGVLIVGILASSCVSKKKYDALSREKWSADKELMQVKQQNQELNSQIRKNTEDFNRIRTDLTANNAAKDNTIAEIAAELERQKKQISRLKADIENAQNNMLLSSTSSNEQIKKLQDRLKVSSEDKKAIQQKYEELEFSSRGLKMQIEQLNGRIAEKERQIANAQEGTAFVEKQIGSLKSQISKLKQENEKYRNQVNLLKKELGI